MQLGPYTIDGEIGRGGAGVVLRGRAPDGAAVAIKVLLKTDRGRAAERFARERHVHAELAREGGGFVPLLDAGDSPQGPYLVMPFLPGGTLRDRMNRGPWPIHAVVRLGRTLARALGRAHAAGVVHRDLKPENVLYDQGDGPLIADLGLAKHLAEAAGVQGITQTGTIAGTLGYMPPEQMLDAKHVGPQADVFALGAVLYECLTGVPGFPGASQVDVVSRMLSRSFTRILELRPDAPEPLCAVIERCLEPEPEARYADGAALATALLQAEGSAVRSARRPSGGPAPIAIGLVVAGVALALLVVLVSSRRGPEPAAPPLASQPSTEAPTRPTTEAPTRPTTEAPTRPTTEAPTRPTTEAPPSPATEAAPPAPAPEPSDRLLPTRSTTLATRLAGLGGLEPQRTLGSDELRSVAPLRALATSPGALLSVDALGFVRCLDAADLSPRFMYRMGFAPTAFAASADGRAIALASPGQLVVIPNGGGSLKKADVFQAELPPGTTVLALALGVEPPLLFYGEGRKIRVLDPAARKAVTTLDAHAADVTALAVANRRLVSADASGKLMSWRVGARREDCALERTIGTHGHAVECLALSSAGALVVSGDVTTTWAQWDVRTGTPQSKLTLSESGAPLAASFVGGDAAVWVAMERAVVRWQVDDPRRVERLPLGRPSSLAAFTASGARQIFSDPEGFILGIVDLEHRREIPPAPGHYAPVSGAAACDGGVYSIDLSGRVLFWSSDGAMSPVHSGRLGGGGTVGEAPTIAAARDGRALAVSGQQGVLLDRAGSDPRVLDEPGLTWVTTTADERFLAGTASGQVLWLGPSGRVLERRALFTGRVLQVLGAGADTLALGVEGQRVVLAAFGPAARLRVDVPGVRPGALAAVARGHAALGTESGRLLVFDTSRADRAPREVAGHEGAIVWATSSPDGRVLLSVGEDDTLAAWAVGDDGDLSLLERRALAVTGDRLRSMTPLADGRLLLGSARGVGVPCRWARPR